MDLTVREASPADRQQLANLIHFETHVHRHLDWRTPLDWLGHRPYLIAEFNGALVGALACPLDEPEIAWIRMFAAGGAVPLGDVWQALWDAGRSALEQLEKSRVAAIVMQGWFKSLLETSGFVNTDNVIVLRWEQDNTLPLPRWKAGSIRTMTPADLEMVSKIDSIAFEPEWRNSVTALELAYQQAAFATVMVEGQDVLGFQISTSSLAGGHLARLAVHPAMQGQGIGYALVYDLLEELQARGINQVTVNTQQDNLASLALYARAGFSRTDEFYQVYQYFPQAAG
jgi:ribosomal protein S18 acetylase RimI-like enzyme